MNQLLTIFPAFLDNWIGGLTLMIVMSYLIMKACDVFELATDYLGRNMSEGVKGATLNAVGSSMPEFLTTVFFLLMYSYLTFKYFNCWTFKPYIIINIFKIKRHK